jgi:hypothetical protein
MRPLEAAFLLDGDGEEAAVVGYLVCADRCKGGE